MLRDIDKHKLVVTQANALALSAQKMTLQEKRLLLLLISQVRRDDEEFKLYYIPIHAIGDYLEIKETAIHSRIRPISRKLLSRVIDVDEPREDPNDPDDEDAFVQFQWVAKSRYISKRKSPLGVACLEMRLHEDLRPWLLELKAHFGSVPLLQIATMPSFGSVRVFEILYFASHRLNKTNLYFDLEDFKRRLGLENAYPNFKDFRVRVLDKAQKDCAAKSPLIFAWEPEKEGKKVVGLHFHLRKNKKVELLPPPMPEVREDPQQAFNFDEPAPAPTLSPAQQRADEAMQQNGIDANMRAQLITEHDPARITENCRIARERREAGKVRQSLAALTIDAIRKDYREQVAPVEREAVEKEEAKKAARQKARDEEKELGEFQKEFSALNEEKRKSAWESLDPAIQAEKEAEFRATLNPMMKRHHADKTFANAGFRMLFFPWFGQQVLSPDELDFAGWMLREKGREVEKNERDEWRFKKS